MTHAVDCFFTVFIAIAIHRLWLYEDIFSKIRAKMPKALRCAPCFAFWAAALAVVWFTVRDVPYVRLIGSVFALYPVVRLYMGLVVIGEAIIAKLRPHETTASETPGQLLARAHRAVIAQVQDKKVKEKSDKKIEECVSCKKPVSVPVTMPAIVEVVDDRKKVVLMTTFSDFLPSYSLVSVVLDQARALDRAGFAVELWVNVFCNLEHYPSSMPDGIVVRKIMPPVSLAEDKVNEDVATSLVTFFQDNLNITNKFPDVVITHDLLFVSWFTIYAEAIHRYARVADDHIRWYHQAHSGPSLPRIVTDATRPRMMLPDGHKIICCNIVDRPRFAEYYATDVSNIVTVQNVRDYERRPMKMAQELGLLDANFVQVYPISGTRMQAKGVGTVIRVFAELARVGRRVKLVFANAHSNGEKEKAEIGHYLTLAADLGLKPDQVIFTSQKYPETATYGLTSTQVSDLMRFGTVFIFPTQGEAGPLVLLEAALSGAMLALNQDVAALKDIIPHDQALWFGFGTRGVEATAKIEEVAQAIDTALFHQFALHSRRTVLSRFTIDSMAARFKEILT